MSPLPDPRRVVTGHDEAGNAIFVADSLAHMAPTSVECDFTVLYETHQFPASNDVWEDPMLTRTMNLANEKGLVLRCVDFKPNTKTLFHRTESLDFGIVFSGEIVYLDNGVELTLKAGDVCVQRGTIHGWDNRTDQTTRIYFLLTGKCFEQSDLVTVAKDDLAATPVKIGDKVLGEHGFDPKDVESGGQL
ncbi:hypothetical protein JDV02_002464 [Purpureocillium takamizusanense]|uniref:Cupin type-2 domain-containing protein n=1 Tax=Purpureocillium takamizusanense TaxID=2060973 RepID=A0A9Q8Q9E4_9HYPO|nr:uncharacterized protein JDV02_002464 [Purpureocillium takamizusanense]UNI15983.1 hypothetical protein JDV02_002464 [Purpureocillium takamizusanense]